MDRVSKLVCGWGVNDVDYNVVINIELAKVNGKRRQKTIWICPYYRDWCSILERCFSNVYQTKYPTYIGCTIDPDWKYLSNFIKWVDSQPNRDWMNCIPDKDFLSSGNKHYGANTVVYINQSLNNFILDCTRSRGKYLLGVSDSISKSKPYQARCHNPFGNVRSYLGLFTTEIEAHKAWQAKKHEYACQLADLQQDPRVAKALRERYAPDKDWTNK